MSEGIWIKKSLVAAVAAGTLVLAGCNEETTEAVENSTSTEQSGNSGNYQSVNNPTGSITGLVTDTNGYPIEGATVYLGEQTATTNAGGQYYFSDVAVTRTVKNDNDQYAQALALTIVAPEGYLGATVTVMPQAQIFNGSEDENSVTNPVTTFVDGFNASAGTAVLPETVATVSGVLRDSESGEALSGVNVALDMLRTSQGADQEQDQDGVKTSYSTKSYIATTNSSGDFVFSGVPADAVLRLAANGYKVTQEVETSDEYNTVSLGQVLAEPVDSDDTIAPFVVSVAEVVDQTAARGILNDDTKSSFTIKFSEKLVQDAIDVNSIKVRNVTSADYLDHTAVLDGNELTITLDSALTEEQEGDELDVLLLKDDFIDTARPSNALGITDAGGDDSPVGFDENMTNAVGGSYVRLLLKAYKEANTDAVAVSLTDAQVQKDEQGVNDLEKIQEHSAFFDVDDDNVGIQQLNAADDDDDNSTPDAQERMQALLEKLAGKAGIQESTALNANTVGLSFEPTNASYYELDVLDSNGVSKFNGLAMVEIDNAEFDPAPNANRFVPASDLSADDKLYLVVQGVEPDDSVVVTPFDEFGYSGNSASVTLKDNVAPTTILQRSYRVPAESNNGEVVSKQYGGGGEQSATPVAEIGTPYLNVSPRMLSVVDGDSGGTDELGKDGLYSLKQLFDLNVVDPDTGKPHIDLLDRENDVAGVYDSKAYEKWTDQSGADYLGSRTIGVAFSEDVILDETQDPTYTGPEGASTTALLSDYAVNNDVMRRDNGDESDELDDGNGSTETVNLNDDLIQFSVDNVLSLANLDHNSTIDFSAVIEDKSGNVGGSHAAVVIGDAMPPMVKTAEYQGNKLVITFNEAISVDLDTNITLGSQTITLDNDTVDAFNDSTDKTVLEVLSSAWDGNLNRTEEFGIGQYKEDDPSDDDFSSDKHRHARLDFSNIEDVRGNKWDDYQDSTTEYFLHQPDFAVVDLTGNFSVNGANNGTSDGDDTVVVRFNASHPIDLTGWDSDDNGEITGDELDGKFSFDSGATATIDEDSSSRRVDVSNGGKTLVVTLKLTAPVESGDWVELATPWVSAWDSSEDHPANNSRVNFNF